MSILLCRLIEDFIQCEHLILIVINGVTTREGFDILSFVSLLASMLGG
jgi:hypothetical protein